MHAGGLRIISPVGAGMRLYATLELDPHSRWWMADFEGLPVHTWSRSRTKVARCAREALALHLDVSEDAVEDRIVFRRPPFPGTVEDALEGAGRSRPAADTTSAQAPEARAAAARALVQDAHLSMRGAAEVLGPSHQRVQQLLAS
jgi:hypothetical protein